MYLVIYDLSDNALRTRIADALIRLGLERIQYSVFAGDRAITPKSEVWNRIAQLCEGSDLESGNIILVEVSRTAFRNMLQLGQNPLNTPYLSGDVDVIFPDGESI